MSNYSNALSQNPASSAAGREAAREAERGLSGAVPDAVFVFCTDDYDAPAVLTAVREVFGLVPVAGCSAPGVFSQGRIVRSGVSVTACSDSGLSVRPAMVAGLANGGSVDGGAKATERALNLLEEEGCDAGGDTAVMVLLSDGIAGNSVEVVRGAVDVLGREMRVVGGGAGDNLKFERAHQFCNDAASSESALAIGIAARDPIGVALRHGCAPASAPMQVTGVAGRAVTALDFGSAFERYREAARGLGIEDLDRDNFTQFAMLHPLGLVQAQGDHVLRSPLQSGEDGTIHCCSDIPVNALVRLMEGDQASLLSAARDAARAATAQLGGRTPAAALVFACISRGFVLGDDEQGLSQELGAVREALGDDVPVFGCVTFGGFGSLSAGLPQYHSKSINLAVFAEPSVAPAA